MSTTIRAEISQHNKYYIDKHRYYELKHFCLQYPIWIKLYKIYEDPSMGSSIVNIVNGTTNGITNVTEKYALAKASLSKNIKIIEKSAKEADEYLYPYIIKGVTEDLSYTYLKTKLDMPCGKDMYYDRYRKFFWILSNRRL